MNRRYLGSVITSVLGAPGSDKSTIAPLLAGLLPGRAVLDWDAFMRPAAALAGREIPDHPETCPAYRELVRTAIGVMAQLPVVLLGVCTPEELKDWPIDAWVLLDCSEQERRRRLGQLTLAVAGRVGAVLGVDPEPDMLRRARQAAGEAGVGNASWMLGADTDIPALHRLLGDGSVAMVTIAQALHWMRHEELFQGTGPQPPARRPSRFSSSFPRESHQARARRNAPRSPLRAVGDHEPETDLM